ncbi:beta-L-arabinofuranosidase domain-containing protein [Actinoplanes sp. CA-015351]|uniref:beta-L-arabinofuranosidase domain-containing protein n=1 Tax=Actinoplanes sp. CA-015351 TaxID=3239897 RepID=UPI003D97226A
MTTTRTAPRRRSRPRAPTTEWGHELYCYGHLIQAAVARARTAGHDQLADVAIRDAAVLRGHAVRAVYLASGAVDVAVETGDDELLDAVARQWRNTVARRTYLTGGFGSRHQDEAFGDDFVLPPDRAYSETCAGSAR